MVGGNVSKYTGVTASFLTTQCCDHAIGVGDAPECGEFSHAET